MKNVNILLGKSFAIGGLIFSLAGFGATGVSNAFPEPTPDTGSYDEQTDLKQEGCWGKVSKPPKAWKIGHPTSGGCAHAR